jgi:hypothetical protein
MFKKLLILFSVLLLSLSIGEIVLRQMGYRPDYYDDSPITRRYIDMNHRRYFYPDSSLGWRLAPGHYYLPLEDNKYSEATHDSLGYRISSPGSLSSGLNAQKLFLLGCSFTYGVYLRDSESLAYRIQDSLPEVHVYDMAVPAYGDIQSLISLRQSIAGGLIPNIVILDYSDIHDERNFFSREWQKKLSHERLSFSGIVVPEGRISAGRLLVQYGKLDYRAMPLSKYSVLANMADDAMNNIRDDRMSASEVSYQTILAMAQTCREINARFIVAGIDNDDKTISMLHRCQKAKIETINLCEGCSTCTNPPDGSTHYIYSQKLLTLLKKKPIGG